jgi:hypothetical protein
MHFDELPAELKKALAAALQRATDALADAGYEIVDERTPGFTRAFELWFGMFISEFRRFTQADCERDGDEGFRTALRFLLAKAIEPRVPRLTPIDPMWSLPHLRDLEACPRSPPVSEHLTLACCSRQRNGLTR